MKYTLALPFFIACILNTDLALCQEAPAGKDVSINKTDDVICKDSVGHAITYKEALALLRTGKYVSVPVMNQFGQIEHTIKIPTKAEKEKYQTFIGAKTVIAMSGLKTEMKYHLDDTIPPIKAYSVLGEPFSIRLDDPAKKMVLIFLKENTRWDDSEPLLSKLIVDYPNVSFVVCADDSKKKLNHFFSESTLRTTKNLYLAGSEFTLSMGVKNFPTYIVTNYRGKILHLVPPLPKSEIAIEALKVFLEHSN